MTHCGEVWRVVPSTPDLPVSSEGRVMTAPHLGGKIHRLVAEAFHGTTPFDGAVVMHVDENAANNRASNLKWGTQKENLNAPGFLKYCRSRTGEDSPGTKGRKNSCATSVSSSPSSSG